MRYRNANARRRAELVERALRHAEGSKRREKLRTEALAILTPWERALYELHLHYNATRWLHGTWADAFLLEFCRGCATGFCFCGIVVSVLDLEPEARWSLGMRAMTERVRAGTFRLDEDDRDFGAMLAGARPS